MKTAHRITMGILAGLLLCRNVYGETLKEPEIESSAAVVMDMDSGEILYQKNENEKYYPASIVKLLTALVTAENVQPDATVVFSHDAVYGVEEGSGNPLQLEAGDKLTVEDCMYAMILESSNQASNALAEYVAGSNEKFAQLMNEEAVNLGCKNSNFVNPSGLNDKEQQVTASDMALIARAALRNPTVREIASAKTWRLSPTLNNVDGITLQMEHQLLNGDQYSYAYAFAGKTGYTEAAGNTLVTAADKDGKEILSVVLKSDMTHYKDTIKLLNYGFSVLENPSVTEAPDKEESVTETTEENKITSTKNNGSLMGTAVRVLAGITAAYLCAVLVQKYRRRLRKARKRK